MFQQNFSISPHLTSPRCFEYSQKKTLFTEAERPCLIKGLRHFLIFAVTACVAKICCFFFNPVGSIIPGFLWFQGIYLWEAFMSNIQQIPRWYLPHRFSILWKFVLISEGFLFISTKIYFFNGAKNHLLQLVKCTNLRLYY